MSDLLTTETIGHVGRLTFRNPPHNHATVGVLAAIADGLAAFDADPAIRAVVLASEGKAFCAGADLVSADGFGAEGDDPLREFYDQVIRIFHNAKPIVAAVQGAAVGAGLGLAVAADFRVASPDARFTANFVKLGFHPGFGLTHTLPRIIGQQHAAEMILTGARYKPEEVIGWGLVDRIAPSTEALPDAALAFAEAIAENAPLSLLATRATLRGDLAEAVRDRLVIEHREQTLLLPTADYAEGRKAVGERRPGAFTGR